MTTTTSTARHELAPDAAPQTATLVGRALSCGYGERTVLRELDIELIDGQITTLIGANGCGKSTLLRTLGRLHKPSAGEVSLRGEPITSIPTKHLATRLALLPQRPSAPPGMSVRELVLRGRAPHQRLFGGASTADHEAVDRALTDTGALAFAEQELGSLSGGQLQRAWIALVLAQDTPIVLLDEPTTYLDLTHQLEVLRLVRRINRDRGTTVLMVLHDLSLAARYSDRLIALHDGAIAADGTPREVLTPALLAEAFALAAEVIDDPRTGTPLIVPLDE